MTSPEILAYRLLNVATNRAILFLPDDPIIEALGGMDGYVLEPLGPIYPRPEGADDGKEAT